MPDTLIKVNIFFNKDAVYTCNRYFCKFCLKNYSFLKHHVLCPYCQGYCQCSRCIRNDTIFKLKSMYVHLGGKLKELPHDPFYQKIFMYDLKIAPK